MGGGDSEAASFEPDPLFHSCLAREEGLHLFFFFFFNWPKGTDFQRSFQNRVGSVLEVFLGCKKRLLAPRRWPFGDCPGEL